MERLSLSMAAEKIGCSDSDLSTIFSQEAGCGFADCLNGWTGPAGTCSREP